MAPKSKSKAPRVSKQKINVPVVEKDNSYLLGMPTELREQVYRAVLDTSPASLYSLVLTNRQISGEAKPHLFKQSLVFDGQPELYKWLEIVEHSYLELVTDIQFKLHDIDPDGIVGALGERLRQAAIPDPSNRPDRDTYSEACKLEIERLGKAFRLLPNVRHFTIIATTKADPQPPYHMLALFVRMLVHCFPHLISLTSHDDLPMRYVSDLHKLRRLRFPGIGTTPTKEVTSILSNLPSLVELEVCRINPNSAERASGISGVFQQFRCDVAAIVRETTDLESLALYEYLGKGNGEADQEGMTKAIMDSFGALECHKPTLRSLKSLLEFDLEPWMQKKIAMFIKSSRLYHLEAFDKDFPPLGHLPATIETIVLRCGLLDVPFKPWLEKLVSMAQHHKNQLPNLTEVVIYRNGPSTPSNDNHKRWASERMRKLGIQLWWRTWDGKMPQSGRECL